MKTITQEILDSGRSSMGGFSLRQANCFGIEAKSWPVGEDGKQLADWSSIVCGREFKESDVRRFLRLRDKHLDGSDEETSVAEKNAIDNGLYNPLLFM